MYIQPSAGGGNVFDVNYTYDEANRLIGVRDAITVKNAGYAYFDIGALKTSTNPNGVTAHRTLDTLNRLDTLQYKTDSTTLLSSLDYTYDDRSNVTQLVRVDFGAGGTSKNFSFGYDKLSRLTSANYGTETVTYTYDAEGNDSDAFSYGFGSQLSRYRNPGRHARTDAELQLRRWRATGESDR